MDIKDVYIIMSNMAIPGQLKSVLIKGGVLISGVHV